MKKIIMMLLLLVGVMSFSEGEEFAYKGYDLPFTSDGKLHEEILLKGTITADDVVIKIKKLKNGKYQFCFKVKKRGIDYLSGSSDIKITMFRCYSLKSCTA